jgi:hypothetical protein
MHIHPAAIGQHAINISAAGNQRAAATQRAAEVRKRLLKSVDTIDASDPGATFLIGQWMDSRHSQVLPQDEYHSAASGKDPDFG